VTPFKGIGRGDGHVSPYQMLIRFFATIPNTLLLVNRQGNTMFLAV
jgi:hypothetical protein